MTPALAILLGLSVAAVATGDAASDDGRLAVALEAPEEAPAGTSPPLALVVTNSGGAPVTVFHPHSLHKVWGCWKLTLDVERPDGRTFELEPDIVYANAPFPRPAEFRRLDPGAAFRIPLLLDPAPDGAFEPAGWVARIPVPELLARHLPAGVLELLSGVRGETYLISGSRTWLAARDLPANVFPSPGRYRLRARYRNGCAMVLTDDPDRAIAHRQDAWTGDLGAEAALTLVDAPPPAPGGG